MGMSAGGGGRAGGRRRRPASEINVTPLVDVMLVLLIIFMVTAPMMTSGVNVDLPKTDASPVNADTKPITVSLRNDGSLYLGEDPITPEQLVDQLKVQSQNDPNHRIFVRADAHIDYGRVMQVMGQITSGGFTHVALLAQQPQSGQ
ncbi:protein TolR [Gluconobacter sp. NFX36]|uniref:Protein TolR n=1 Tax=Gluconobacter japonicus TaxID=376620 RepID=A0A149S7X7_GLUJA|nr:protein TolR [Gluconobacter japonicus]GAP25083.1 biopolymer transport protein ExbD/TolR [Gluconobacter frateurii NBRC 101659]KXV22829.1 biopolymer transporter ExbD [Gluconobacter japonicus]KXV24747.1 biopolymer transporter ExbD [Gluconobacter japonicus]KXV36236.1 biopolymer transporter ExbD [Gluconobacter japonicus]MBF0869561.1 protein TolR [Gluconobacter japonicus]